MFQIPILKILTKSRSFRRSRKKDFLKGAEVAYETILTAFAKGDIQKFKGLLTPDMNRNFSEAIEQEI